MPVTLITCSFPEIGLRDIQAYIVEDHYDAQSLKGIEAGFTCTTCGQKSSIKGPKNANAYQISICKRCGKYTYLVLYKLGGPLARKTGYAILALQKVPRILLTDVQPDNGFVDPREIMLRTGAIDRYALDEAGWTQQFYQIQRLISVERNESLLRESPVTREDVKVYIATYWESIAALAWRRYLTRGRGAVVIGTTSWEDEPGLGPSTYYFPQTRFVETAWPSPQVTEDVRNYEPSREIAVVIIYTSGKIESVRVGGPRTSPPQAHLRYLAIVDSQRSTITDMQRVILAEMGNELAEYSRVCYSEMGRGVVILSPNFQEYPWSTNIGYCLANDIQDLLEWSESLPISLVQDALRECDPSNNFVVVFQDYTPFTHRTDITGLFLVEYAEIAQLPSKRSSQREDYAPNTQLPTHITGQEPGLSKLHSKIQPPSVKPNNFIPNFNDYDDLMDEDWDDEDWDDLEDDSDLEDDNEFGPYWRSGTVWDD